MKKRVLLVSSAFQGGGVEHVARGNLSELLRRPDRYETAVLTCRPDTLPTCPGLRVYPAEDFRQNASFLSKAKNAMGLEHNGWLLRRCFQEFRPDIVHLHDYIPFTPSLLHALAECRRRYRCRVVLTHHTYSYLCTNDMLYTLPHGEPCERCLGSYDSHILRLNCADNMTVSAAKYLQKNLMKDSLRAAVDLHIAPSQFLRDRLLSAFPSLDVRLVYNPCLQQVDREAAPDKTEDVIYFGRVSREKNLLWAARHFLTEEPERRLLAVGDGPQAGQLASLLPPGETRVRFLRRFLPTGELLPLVRSARFFLLPSLWYENSPVSIVEAANAYTVPVVSDRGGMRELVDLLGAGRLFTPGNAESLHRALEEARLAWEEDRETLRQNRGRLERFTLAAYGRVMDEIYRSL
ncbi:MAG: glycosyltransferase family 4 protein [Provencibacterium sp.]|jgi:glycosyltransferase involved in cell wall biosynthesis|nr:glycosyltransferase family 4 protein [Provencibacterium sp.]